MDYIGGIASGFGYLLTFLGGATGQKLISNYLQRQRDKELKVITKNLTDVSEILKMMRDIVDSTRIERFIVFKGSNGGGVPKPGSEFYVTAIYEEHKDKEKHVKEKYTKISVDGHYIEMLTNIHKNGKCLLKVSEMPDCFLKRIYTAEDIAYSELYYLVNNKNEILFCSLVTSQPEINDSKAKLEIELTIDKMRQIFKKYYV